MNYNEPYDDEYDKGYEYGRLTGSQTGYTEGVEFCMEELKTLILSFVDRKMYTVVNELHELYRQYRRESEIYK